MQQYDNNHEIFLKNRLDASDIILNKLKSKLTIDEIQYIGKLYNKIIKYEKKIKYESNSRCAHRVTNESVRYATLPLVSDHIMLNNFENKRNKYFESYIHKLWSKMIIDYNDLDFERVNFNCCGNDNLIYYRIYIGYIGKFDDMYIFKIGVSYNWKLRKYQHKRTYGHIQVIFMGGYMYDKSKPYTYLETIILRELVLMNKNIYFLPIMMKLNVDGSKDKIVNQCEVFMIKDLSLLDQIIDKIECIILQNEHNYAKIFRKNVDDAINMYKYDPQKLLKLLDDNITFLKSKYDYIHDRYVKKNKKDTYKIKTIRISKNNNGSDNDDNVDNIVCSCVDKYSCCCCCTCFQLSSAVDK